MVRTKLLQNLTPKQDKKTAPNCSFDFKTSGKPTLA